MDVAEAHDNRHWSPRYLDSLTAGIIMDVPCEQDHHQAAQSDQLCQSLRSRTAGPLE